MNADNNADNLVQCKIDALLKFNSTIYHQCRKVFRFIFLFSAIAFFANPPAAAATDTPSLIVAPGNHSSDTDAITDISSAASSAPAGAHIQINEGTYLVDNPIILRTKNIKLSGAGANKTIILAKNANQPVFLIEASGVSIEDVTINALVGNGPQRASYAIWIKEGSERCNISHTKILNTAATAIIAVGEK